MAAAYRPLGVYPAPADDSANVQPAVVVGDDQAWSDDNDATWVEYPHHNATGDAAIAYADLPAISQPFNTWWLSLRAEPLNPDAQAHVQIFSLDGAAFPMVANANFTEGGVVWYDLAGDPNHVASFTRPLRLTIADNQGVVTGSNPNDFRIYEVILWVDGPARSATYNRILQRGNDGLGASGGRRILQGRTMQATNRRGNTIH